MRNQMPLPEEGEQARSPAEEPSVALAGLALDRSQHILSSSSMPNVHHSQPGILLQNWAQSASELAGSLSDFEQSPFVQSNAVFTSNFTMRAGAVPFNFFSSASASSTP
eukprot:CAMPEP_0169167418 /NCGR_PEP_ID=MMETSP1015-20121227/60466_1 /TAXON_ID=342587 /ORGANISM="Karlodinium micrum, Strain CCMP2283" /LENGTH=108 /DNA_ID=CAMNT_0009240137 /DNA_START=200 /DNA_END=526 /DNA_ORIENTATION=-